MSDFLNLKKHLRKQISLNKIVVASYIENINIPYISFI